jgi:hypothetical protein
MILTELTVTGLRGIELAALQIMPGVAPDCGDQGYGKTLAARRNGSSRLGRSFLMRDSRQQIELEQSHLRVICRCWPFWASGDWASRSPGAERSRGSVLRGQPDPLVRVR